MAYAIAVDQSLLLDGDGADAADVNTPIANLKTAVQDLGNGVSAPEQFRLVEIATPANPAASSQKLYMNSTDHKIHALTSAGVDRTLEVTVYPRMPRGRLTLTSGVPVTTSNVTAATTIYYTPYGGNEVTLYNGTTWDSYGLTEISASLAGLTASLPYDVYLYYSAGLALELVAWSSTSTRATALAVQDGAYVKTGTLTKRYIGTICMTSSVGQCEDSITNRLVWNYYNRVNRSFQVNDATDSWTYTSATFRSFNNSTANRANFILGVAEDAVAMDFLCIGSTTTPGQSAGIGLDSTSSPAAVGIARQNSTLVESFTAMYIGTPAAGFHFLQLLESGAATSTFFGDGGSAVIQSGAKGMIAA